jgi:hypothetical protein
LAVGPCLYPQFGQITIVLIARNSDKPSFGKFNRCMRARSDCQSFWCLSTQQHRRPLPLASKIVISWRVTPDYGSLVKERHSNLVSPGPRSHARRRVWPQPLHWAYRRSGSWMGWDDLLRTSAGHSKRRSRGRFCPSIALASPDARRRRGASHRRSRLRWHRPQPLLESPA